MTITEVERLKKQLQRRNAEIRRLRKAIRDYDRGDECDYCGGGGSTLVGRCEQCDGRGSIRDIRKLRATIGGKP